MLVMCDDEINTFPIPQTPMGFIPSIETVLREAPSEFEMNKVWNSETASGFATLEDWAYGRIAEARPQRELPIQAFFWGLAAHEY